MAGSGGWSGTRARTTGAGAAGGRGRRWPWAVAAVTAGGLAGAAVAVVLGRRRGPRPEDVSEPDEVQAVVDRAGPAGG